MKYRRDISKQIGKNIRRMRLKRNILQNDLARRLGYEPLAMCMIEQGKTHVKAHILPELATELDCKLDDFYEVA